MGHTFLSTREANLGATHHANRYAKELFLGYHIFQNNIFNIHTYVCVCSQSSSSTVDLSSANQIMQISVKGPMDQRKPSNIMCSCMSFSLATLQPAIVAKRKKAAGQFFSGEFGQLLSGEAGEALIFYANNTTIWLFNIAMENHHF